MKFLFAGYIQTPEQTNPQDWLQRLAAYFGVLEALAKEHEVISIEQISYTGDYSHNGVKYLFRDFGKRVLHFPFRLHRLIKQLSPDIIIIHGDDFPLQVLQLRMYVGSKTKIIVQSHSKTILTGYKRWVQKIADRYIDAYFFTSKQMSTPWVQQKLIANAAKVREVMVGSSVFTIIDKQIARQATNTDGDPMFLWVGRLNQNKDPVTAIQAFHHFSKDWPGAKLYMLYHTDERLQEIKEWLQKHGACSQIELIGKVVHEEMGKWFSAADFLISTSHFEVFGAVVPEAVSCNCIPILSDILSFRAITDNGSIGFLFKTGDHTSLYEAMVKAASTNREEEIGKMLLYFKKHLSFDAIAKQIENTAFALIK